jgi:hypothetical protein
MDGNAKAKAVIGHLHQPEERQEQPDHVGIAVDEGDGFRGPPGLSLGPLGLVGDGASDDGSRSDSFPTSSVTDSTYRRRSSSSLRRRSS